MSDAKRSATVVGAGAGGQGMAGYLVRKGFNVRLWNRPEPSELERWLKPIADAGQLEIIGWQPGMVSIDRASTELAETTDGASVVFVITTADAYPSLAREMASVLSAGQMVVLMSGGTGASLEFRAAFVAAGGAPGVLVAEATTTIVNSRPAGPGKVEILGEKRRVEFAALPSSQTARALQLVQGLPFVAVSDVLSTGITNYSVAVHALPMVLNAAWLEDRPAGFLYYRQGISPAVARAIERVEAERLALASALGVETTTLQSYLVDSLGAPPGDLYTSVHECGIYATVPAPPALDHRYLWEDVMTGVVPMVGLGRALNVPVPLMEATLTLASALLGRDLASRGRTLEKLGLAGLDARGIRELVRGSDTA